MLQLRRAIAEARRCLSFSCCAKRQHMLDVGLLPQGFQSHDTGPGHVMGAPSAYSYSLMHDSAVKSALDRLKLRILMNSAQPSRDLRIAHMVLAHVHAREASTWPDDALER